MCLTVLGRESVEQLEDWVTSLFSGVEDRDVPEPVAPPKPFLPSQLGRRLRVVPVKDLHNIIVLFPTSPLREHYRSSPTRYLAHLIGHEGPGSILAYLRRRNWANELSAGPSHSASGFSFFEVSIEATEEVCRRRCQSNAASPRASLRAWPPLRRRAWHTPTTWWRSCSSTWPCCAPTAR